MKLKTRLILGFSTIAVIAALIGLVGYMGLKNILKSQSEITHVRLPGVRALYGISEAQIAIWVGERGLINNKMMQSDIRQAQYQFIDNNFDKANKAISIYDSLPKTSEEEAKWGELQSAWSNWKNLHQKVVDISKEKDRLKESGIPLDDKQILDLDEKAFQASLDSRTASLNFSKINEDIINLNSKIADDENDEANKNAQLLTWILVLFIFGGVTIALIFGFLISNKIQNIVKAILTESNNLTQDAINGKLHSRGNTAAINEEFREIIEGMNSTLDAVIKPLNVAATYIDRIAKGDMPEKITDNYNGDFNTIKNNINSLIDAMNSITLSAKLVSKGDLDEIGRASCRERVLTDV